MSFTHVNAPISLLRSLKLLMVPMAIMGALLAFGPRGAGAAPVPTNSEFDLPWGTVTVRGSGFVADAIGGSLHVTVGEGSAELRIGDRAQIDLSAGAEVRLSLLSFADIDSIKVDVVKGDALVSLLVAGRDASGAPVLVVMDGPNTLVTPGTAFSIATGPIEPNIDSPSDSSSDTVALAD